MKTIKVFDFFSGCGGTSQGFLQAGFDIAFGLDFDRDSANSFRSNFPNAVFINSDIRGVDNKTIKKIVDNERDDSYILFSGCAPCQPYSRQNSNKKNDDPRLDLLQEFSRFVKYVKPDFVFIENVPGMQKFDKDEGTFNDFVQTLIRLKYSVDYQIIPAAFYGVPQTRERLVLLAAKNHKVSLPLQTHGIENIPYSTVREWIGSLPSISAGEAHVSIPDHVAASLSEKNIERIKNTPEGGGRESWPDELILDCHKNHKGHSDVYGRLSWDKPASGLTTRCISYSNGRFGHPSQNRAISVREAACLQTFPMDYKFSGAMLSKAKQIGNAVPPKMAEAIGKQLIQIIKS